MKTKITLTVFLLIYLCNMAWAQKKVIKIETSFNLDVNFIPTRKEPLLFFVKYTNLPESPKSNYEITFKPKNDTKFAGEDTTILLNEPLDIEEIRLELNKKLQIEGDSLQAVINNTIYDFAYILDTIARPIAEQRIAGNLFVNCYVRTFPKDSSNGNHQKRQVFVQQHTQELTRMKLRADSLEAKKLIYKIAIDKNKEELEKIKENLNQNVSKTENLKLETTKELSEIETVESQIATNQTKLAVLRQSDLAKSAAKTNSSDYLSTLKIAISEISGATTDKIDSLAKVYKLILEKKDPAYPINLNTGADDTSFVNKQTTLLGSLSAIQSKVEKKISERSVAFEDEQISRKRLEKTLKDLEVRKNELNNKVEKNNINIAELDRNVLQIKQSKIVTDNQILLNTNAINDSLLSETNVLIKKKTSLLDSLSIFRVNKVSVQIERGFMERIQVYIPSKKSDQYDIYENIFAIGFSSINNYKKLSGTKLFSRLTDEYIYLSDVVANYDNLLENYTRDYSPADTTINHFEPKQGFIRLNREQFANLFDARIYTDLMGIRDDKPNGLIQIDIFRKFNLLTTREQLNRSRSDWGVFTYLNMFGSLSKIENNKKYLPLRNENKGSAGQLTSPYYATNLDFRLYQNLSLGAELNLFLFDYPDGKFTGYVDVGSVYGQTPLTYNKRIVTGNTVSQSERDSSLVAHSATIYPKLTFEIFSEKRVRLSMSYQFNTTRIYSNNNFKAIASYAKSDLLDRATEPYARRSHMLEVNLTASPTSAKHGRFFFRARYFIQNRDHNTFFSQIQFGYTYNLRLKKFE